MSEITVNKKGTILDEEENFKPIHDNFRFYDHFSKFSGLAVAQLYFCLLYTSPSPRDRISSRMPSSA